MTSSESKSWTTKVQGLRGLAARLSENCVEPSEELAREPYIFSLVHDDKWEVRKALATVLGELKYIPDTKIEIALSILGEDQNKWVRKAAIRALRLRRDRASHFVQRMQSLDRIDDPLFQVVVSRIDGARVGGITPAKVYEIAKEFGDRSYSELAADTAHEVRSLMTPLEGSLVHLRDYLSSTDARGDNTVLGYVTTALGQLDLLKGLVESLQTYGVSQIGPFETVLLGRLLEEAVSISFERAKLNRSEIFLEINVPPDMSVNMVYKRLLRAFVNLVTNALQAMKGAGKLTISATATEGEKRAVLVKIADTGQGMSPTQVRQAFTRFSSTRKGNGGTGLGLPIAQKVIEQDHGGLIRMESVKGQGTCVSITLPVDCRSLES